MANWINDIQSVGRGFRPGMEIKMISDGTGASKSVWMDIESDDFKPWRENMRPHYAEYCDFDTGETYWKKFNRLPKSSDLYRADKVIRLNEDGTYQYVKNRKDGNLRQLTEEEIMWVLLHV
jgi:hypothetical protein